MPKRILVIDGISTHRIRLSALLGEAGYQVATARDLFEVQGAIGQNDLVVVGVPEDGLGQLTAQVVTALQGANCPVFCLDGKLSPLRRLLMLRAGARDALPYRASDELILAMARRLIREGEARRETERRRMTAASFGFSDAPSAFDRPAQVVCVGSFTLLPERLNALLKHNVVRDHSRSEGGEEARDGSHADAFLLKTGSDAQTLRQVLPDLRDATHLAPVPILAVYPEDRPNMATQALALGATDVAPDTAGLEEFELRLDRMLDRKSQQDALKRCDEQSYRMAATDMLTGLYNRRYAESYVSRLFSRGDGSRSEFCVLLLDLDHFKAVNDTYGHAIGDRVLAEVAHRLQHNLRACDLVARFGGEEFLVVLPETSCATASLLAERLRCAVAAQAVSVSSDLKLNITASIGVSAGRVEAQMAHKRTGTFDAPQEFTSDPFQAVFEAADTALYRAKSNGRDRVEVNSV
ncbi:MAG: diguanylate cyclase [Pseudomonadota bacterium]